MKFAISIRTGKEVYADYKVSRRERYKCPCCDSEVRLRAGYDRTPYFAHASSQTNQAKLNCEDYHPGNGYYFPTQVTKRSVSIAESKIELGRHDYFTTLCVEDSESDFRLYLSIPTISFDRENPISPRDLQKIKIRITAEGILIGKLLPAIELFTGGVKTQFDVKPTEKDYELKAVNNSGSEVDFDFLESRIEGLSPKGNLFGKIDEEWVRIFPNSEIEWGGEFYYVAQSNTSVPHKCFPAEIAVSNGYTRKWKLWRIKLPAEPDANVENWLNLLDYFVVEARWKLQLFSVPRHYDAFERVYHFNVGEPILFKATSPFSKSETVLICETKETTEEKQIETNAENNYFFSVKNGFDKIYLDGFPETEIKTVFINDDDADSLNDKISSLPSINFSLKDDFFESFPENNDEKTNIIQTDGKLEPTDVEIILKPEALNDFVKRKVGIRFSGDSMVFKDRLTFKEAKGEILDIIRKKHTGTLTIDAGSLGVIALNLENEIIAERVESRLPSKISGWLSAIAASRLDRAYIGSNSGSRISMADEKSRRKIIHSRSPFVTAQARAMSKRKK